MIRTKQIILIVILTVCYGFTGQVPTISAQACPTLSVGDADCSGKTDLRDYEIWRREYLKLETTTKADFNGVGGVDLIDYETWRRAFVGGGTNPPPPPTATPTPTTGGGGSKHQVKSIALYNGGTFNNASIINTVITNAKNAKATHVVANVARVVNCLACSDLVDDPRADYGSPQEWVALNNAAKANGLKLGIKFALEYYENGSFVYFRGQAKPSDLPRFIQNYENFAIQYADVLDPDFIVFGTELGGMVGQGTEPQWAALFNRMRAKYPGIGVFYGANPFDYFFSGTDLPGQAFFQAQGWADDLGYVSDSWYPSFAPDGSHEHTEQEIRDFWLPRFNNGNGTEPYDIPWDDNKNWDSNAGARLFKFANKYDLKIFITEMGIHNTKGGAYDSAAWGSTPFSTVEAANAYKVALPAAYGTGRVKGLILWNLDGQPDGAQSNFNLQSASINFLSTFWPTVQ